MDFVGGRMKPASQQKLAEKLIILNERAEGLLIRLHYSKQVGLHCLKWPRYIYIIMKYLHVK